jgi:hypothetical protein
MPPMLKRPRRGRLLLRTWRDAATGRCSTSKIGFTITYGMVTLSAALWSDGAQSVAGQTDLNGVLYGTSSAGGTFGGSSGRYGTLFDAVTGRFALNAKHLGGDLPPHGTRMTSSKTTPPTECGRRRGLGERAEELRSEELAALLGERSAMIGGDAFE